MQAAEAAQSLVIFDCQLPIAELSFGNLERAFADGPLAENLKLNL
jgi:hypothetical protein